MAVACGVDFGTSNSTVGWSRPDLPALLALEEGKATLPSAIFFNAEEETTSYGRAALADYLAGYEGRLMRSMKSLLGTPLMDGQTEVLGHALPFKALLQQFIGELKRRAEQAAGRSFEHVVLGRPVFFVDDDARADRLAEDTLAGIAQAAGFKEISFQFEPIAAAFDYEATVDREELVLVVDIGGGTSDFSLVRLGPDRAQLTDRRSDILASGGVHIGGSDFDKYFSLAQVMPLFGMGSLLAGGGAVPSSYYFNLATWHTINQLYTQKSQASLKELLREARERSRLERLVKLVEQRDGHWLAYKVEQAKIALSGDLETCLELERLHDVPPLCLRREAMDQAIVHLVESIEQAVLRLLTDSGLHADSIDTVFFTGGSSAVGLLRQKIAALLPHARSVEGDLFGSIGAGLALDAARKFS